MFSLYHWGVFQFFVPILLNYFTNNLTVIAAEEPLDYIYKHMSLYQKDKIRYFKNTIINIGTLNKAIKDAKNGNYVTLMPELSAIGDYSPIKNKLDFLGTEIKAPLGPSAISYYSNTPLYAVWIDHKDDFKLKINFKKIAEGAEKTHVEKKEQIKYNTKKTWEHLEKLVLNSPVQWHGWEIMDRIQRGF